MNELLLRRRVAASKSLPYDAEVEYIYSTKYRNQYIELPYTPNINTYAEIEVMFLGKNTYGFFGSRLDPLRFCATTFSSGNQVAFAMTNNNWPSSRLTYSLNQTYKLFAKNGEYGWDNNVYQSAALQSFQTTEKINLFRVKGLDGKYSYSEMAVRSFVIRENDNLVMDLIPVRVGSTGYLYDRVSKQLFGNQGDNVLYLGPDK